MEYKELEEKLLEEFRVLWEEWKVSKNVKMEIIENESKKFLIKAIISKSYLAGLDRAQEIINK